NAFEIYKRDDLLSDLFAEFRSRLNKVGGVAKEGTVDAVMLHLGLAYMYWWSGDKEQATQELAEASARAPQDLDLRLEVAALREAQGEPEAALAVVEGITPLDHTMMQKRETMALRLAALTGNVERARQAADRLFGLRLDAEEQIKLAAQMQQL